MKMRLATLSALGLLLMIATAHAVPGPALLELYITGLATTGDMDDFTNDFAEVDMETTVHHGINTFATSHGWWSYDRDAYGGAVKSIPEELVWTGCAIPASITLDVYGYEDDVSSHDYMGQRTSVSPVEFGEEFIVETVGGTSSNAKFRLRLDLVTSTGTDCIV